MLLLVSFLCYLMWMTVFAATFLMWALCKCYRDWIMIAFAQCLNQECHCKYCHPHQIAKEAHQEEQRVAQPSMLAWLMAELPFAYGIENGMLVSTEVLQMAYNLGCTWIAERITENISVICNSTLIFIPRLHCSMLSSKFKIDKVCPGSSLITYSSQDNVINKSNHNYSALYTKMCWAWSLLFVGSIKFVGTIFHAYTT